MLSCNKCRVCFPSGPQPEARSFDSSYRALRHFNDLFNAGHAPTMCQDETAGYRVCVQPAQTMRTEAAPEQRKLRCVPV